ncbi:enoyl-CoA hydratase-related protein, partial [Mycobacterium sp.]|uniref:enoyl-CoA hydratase-related protein n=1 Tax=Mycobacterium sp. TaxID=1785 RepID=UPI002C53112D
MSAVTAQWNRVSRRPLSDVLDELRGARTLTFDEHGRGIVVMSVNRPHRANSQTVEMFGEIAWATAVLRHASARALVVTGAGGKAFVSGADISKFESERASKEAIERAGLQAKDIDMIVYATLSPDVNFPGTGVFVQR